MWCCLSANDFMICDSNIPIYAADPGDTICLPYAQRADAMIAATALEYSMPLATRNEGDFRHLDGLDIVNPFDGSTI
jgi:hypothetical protein